MTDTRYNTGNPVGSADPRDRDDNTKNLDELVNSTSNTSHPDRLGVERKTWHGMEQDFQQFLLSSGYVGTGSNGAVEDYAAGIKITALNQIIRADGELWRASAGTALPYTTSGTWLGGDENCFVSVGDAVLRGELSAETGATLVNHKQPATGSQARSLAKKSADSYSLDDFWASGDGTDYSMALQRALDSGEPVITGSGKEYIVSGGHTGRGDLTLRDMKLYAPSMSSSDAVIRFDGTDGASQTLTSNLPAMSWTVTVPDGSAFPVEGYAWLESTDQYYDAATFGEVVQIFSKSGNTLTLHSPTLLPYNTTASATITPINMLNNIYLQNVSARSELSTGNQTGLWFERCHNVDVVNFNGYQFDYSHMIFRRSVKGRVLGGTMTRTGATEGLDYGVGVISGCFDIEITGITGKDMRHIVTVGGSSGVSRFITADKCRGTGLTDAALDSHGACHEHAFTNGFFTFSDQASTGCDGIIAQGSNPLISNHTLIGLRRHGVLWTPAAYPIAGVDLTGTIENIYSKKSTADFGNYGVLVSTNTTGVDNIKSVSLRNISSSGFDFNYGIAANQSDVRNTTIAGGSCVTPVGIRAVYIDANGSDVDGLEVIGGHHETGGTSVSPVIDLFGRNGGKVKNWRVVAPHMKRGASGTVGLRLIQTENGIETGSTTEGVVSKYDVDTASTGYSFDYRQSGISTATGSSYTVKEDDLNIVANRAGTVTLTLPTASANPGRVLHVKTVQAQAVSSASTNVVLVPDTTAGTSILPATDGAWAELRCDGVNWVIMKAG